MWAPHWVATCTVVLTNFTSFWTGFSSKQKKPPQNNPQEWQHVARFEEKTPNEYAEITQTLPDPKTHLNSDWHLPFANKHEGTIIHAGHHGKHITTDGLHARYCYHQ